jgi:glycosyltransferase involved in cell wall biosynthesis
MSVVVVIPAYNEGDQLRATLTELCALPYRLILVDDGSFDGTAEIARAYPVYYLRHPINLGQGAALETGTRYAIRLNADAVVHFDADGQHPADQIPALLDPISRGQVDVVLGSRFLNARGTAAVPALKRFLLRGARVVSGVFTGVWLTDTHNGFRALNRKAAESICLRESGFAHATEILEEIRRHGLRYHEIPVAIRYTEYSRKKGQSVWNSCNILFDLILRKVSDGLN